jgi:hypothetical protein
VVWIPAFEVLTQGIPPIRCSDNALTQGYKEGSFGSILVLYIANTYPSATTVTVRLNWPTHGYSTALCLSESMIISPGMYGGIWRHFYGRCYKFMQSHVSCLCLVLQTHTVRISHLQPRKTSRSTKMNVVRMWNAPLPAWFIAFSFSEAKKLQRHKFWDVPPSVKTTTSLRQDIFLKKRTINMRTATHHYNKNENVSLWCKLCSFNLNPHQ